MKVALAFAIGVGLVGTTAIWAASRPAPAHHFPSDAKQGAPVLVELFTSEGCSSCPPADRLLERLQTEQPASGALIVPLSEHVDYWDNSSWRDPFSSASFTARQQSYADSLRSDVYTPQMVVDGRAQLLGSDEGEALSAIAAAKRSRKAEVDLGASYLSSNTVAIDVAIKNTSMLAEPKNDVYVAITENNLSNQVRGGENGGRHLHHTAVVRLLRRIGFANAAAPFSGHASFSLDSKWKRGDIQVVAFVQASRSRKIFGAALTVPKGS